MKKKLTNIDWQRACLNLRMIQPLAAYARQFGCDEKTLHRLANGETSEPRFSIGIDILNAHYDEFPKLHGGLYRD